MISPEAAERILAAVDEAFDEQIAFTAELVSCPSTRTNEAGIQDLMYRSMESRGLEMDRWEIDSTELRGHPGYGPSTVSYDGMVNVVGSYRPKTVKGRSLILNGHVDVVPTGPEDTWSRGPWEAPVIDGWLYGRGSGDMKAGLAANLFALDAIRAAGLAPTAPIHVQSVPEEECTGNGSLSALLRGYTADAVVIPEPEENMLVRANVGVLWFRVRVSGRPTHPREMGTGFNAIDAAYTIMGQLRQLEEAWNSEKASHRYFEDLEHPINFNFGGIQGGDWPSSVPAWCELDVRAAVYPGVTADDAWQQIQDCLHATGLPLTAEKTGFYSEGYVLEEGSEPEDTLAAAHRKAFGTELQTFTTPGYLDARVFTLYGGIPSLVYGPVSEAIHGFDERVQLESVRNVTKTIALFIAHWCGVKESTGL